MPKKIYTKLNITLIHNLKKKIEELKESEEKFRDLVEITTDWVWEADKNGIYTYVSPKVKELLGYSINEVLGKTPFDLMPKEEARKMGEIFKKIATEQKPFYGLENINRHKDGHLVVLETNGIPIFDKKGQFAGYRGIDRDITDRKKAEQALKESEEKYRNLFENANDAIFIADIVTGKIIDANKQAEKLLGRTKKEIIGLHQTKLHPPDQAKYYADKFKRHMRTGNIMDIEAEIIRKDKTIIPVSISASVVSIGNKQTIQGIFRDISQLKKQRKNLKS